MLFMIVPLSTESESRTVTSTQLIENAKELDGSTVTYGGEVVGDILYRGDYAWINVSDGSNSIGIYIPASEADKITYAGRYGVVGDTVSLTGIFHRACTEHGGDMDIHADAITISQQGYTVENKVSAWLIVAAGFISLCALSGLIFIYKKRL